MSILKVAAGHFPALVVEAAIRDVLAVEQTTQQALNPRVASACEPEVDSLVVVEVICVIEEQLGVTLPATFVPRGGYDSVEACVSALLAETRAVWNETVKQTEEQHA